MNLTGRYFQVWEFRVSHQQLLLRSPHDEQHPLNLDVIFAGVDYIELPTRLGEVQISKPTPDDVRRVRAAYRENVAERDVHVFVSGARCFVVVAAGMVLAENDLDFMESSLESFDGREPADPSVNRRRGLPEA